MAGRLEEAERLGTELLESGGDERPGAADIHVRLALIEALRGNVAAARDHLLGCRAWAGSDDVQHKTGYADAEAAILLAEGEYEAAHRAARRAIDAAVGGGLGIAHESLRAAFPVAVEAAVAADRLEEADAHWSSWRDTLVGEIPPFLRAQLTRGVALVAGARGENDGVEEDLLAAEREFGELGYPYWTARTQLDRAEWLARQGRLESRRGSPNEAAATFQQIGAAPMVARARALLEPVLSP